MPGEFSAAAQWHEISCNNISPTKPRAIRIAEKKGKSERSFVYVRVSRWKRRENSTGEKVRKKEKGGKGGKRGRTPRTQRAARDRTIIYLPVCQTSGTRRRVSNAKYRTTKAWWNVWRRQSRNHELGAPSVVISTRSSGEKTLKWLPA